MLKCDLRDKERGFTLIELVVVVAIMATLVGIVTPMFIKYVERSRQSADINTAEAAYTAAMVYFSDADGYVPAKLYYDGNDVKDSNIGIRGYGRSKGEFADFVPDNFPVWNVGGKPNDSGTANYIILTMGASGVEGLGWGVEMSAVHSDGTPKYTNRIYTVAEWNATSSHDKVERDTELFNSLEASAADMTYGELLEMAYNLGLVENRDGNVCIRIATSTVYDDKTTGNKGSDVNEIYAKTLFKKAGYNTLLSNDQTYIVASRYGGSTDVWMDLGYTFDQISHDTVLFNSKATQVVVYGEGGIEKLDGGSLDHDARVSRKRGV